PSSRADPGLPPRRHAALLPLLRPEGAASIPAHVHAGAAEADVRPGPRLSRRERGRRHGEHLPAERRGAFGRAAPGPLEETAMPPAARVTDMHPCPMATPAVPPIPH